MSIRQTITSGYADHVTAVQQHWEAALAAEGYDAALIHAGSKLVSFLDDYEYPFRCNPQLLWWAPLTRHHDSALLVRPGHRPKLYYYQPDDYWYLPPQNPEAWWADEFDVVQTRDSGLWREAAGPRIACIGDAPALAEVAADGHLNPERLVNRIHLARTRKSGYEVACMAEAARLGAVAHKAAESGFRAGKSEYEIHQQYCMSIRMVDAELPYGNIVALNDHGSVLHYQAHEEQPPEEIRSFLIDAGATVHAYASDITRTYAAEPGEFGDLVAAMDATQQRLCNAVRAGLDYRELHLRAHREIAGILHDSGIVKVAADDAVECGLSGVFFPHGLGHFLGLQTHDVAGLIADADGTPIPRPEGHPFLRLTRTLEPGNVLTIEPGLYFIEPLLRKWREEGDAALIDWDRVAALAPCGGIRIEDNMLVTEGEPRNLTRPAFSAV